MSQPKNCHFISRFLTKPWETATRNLTYYDFDKNEFQETSSKKLFAELGTNSPELERFLSEKIETPLGRFRKEHIDSGITELKDWDQFRAIYLLVLTQSQRFSAARNGKNTLEELVDKSDEVLNTIVKPVIDDTELVTYTLGDRDFLCMPETGLFAFWTKDIAGLTEFSVVFSVPIHPQIGVAVVSKSIDKDFFESQRTSRHFLTGASTGADSSKIVVVPSGTIETNGEEKMKESIMRWRELQKEHRQSVEKLRSTVQGAYSGMGVELEYDGSLQKRVKIKNGG